MSIHENMPSADYFDIEAASNSALKKILRSPAHLHNAEPGSGDTRAKQIGSAIHMAILEPDRFALHYLVAEADDRVSAHYKGLAKDVGGDRVLTRPEHRRVQGMQRAAYANSRFCSLIESGGRTELSVVTTDPVTGVPIKARFDWKGDGMSAFDLKKCQDARGSEFCRAIGSYGYYMQIPFYAFVWECETGERMNLSRDFPIVALEEDAPHGCILHDLDEIAIELGRRHFRRALDIYARCLDAGKWPAYSDEITGAVIESEVTSVPHWMAAELLDDVELGGV